MAQIDKIYNNLLEKILKNGSKKNDRTNTGTLSLFGEQIKYKMESGFPLLTTKKIHTKSIIHELLWFLKGDTNIKYLQDNGVTIWDEWADEKGELGPVYGKQWVNWKTTKEKKVLYVDKGLSTEYVPIYINQIQQCIDELKNNPDSRRIMVNAWNVGDLKDMKLPPCHYGFQLYTIELSLEERTTLFCTKTGQKDWRERVQATIEVQGEENLNKEFEKYNIPTRAISLMWNQRSVDTFLGLPFNIACYGFLLSMFAQQTNMLPGDLIGNLGDVHIYDNHVSYVKEQLIRDIEKKSPQLKLKKTGSIFDYDYDDFMILDYESYPNWKNVPIAI